MKEQKNMMEKLGWRLLLQSVLPAPIVTIIEAIDEVKSEEELMLKFDELKNYASELRKTLPIIPIAVEMRRVSIVAIYVCKHFDDCSDVKDRLMRCLDDENMEFLDVNVFEDCIILQEHDPVEKEIWDKEVAPVIQKILNEEFDKEIKSIAYA